MVWFSDFNKSWDLKLRLKLKSEWIHEYRFMLGYDIDKALMKLVKA